MAAATADKKILEYMTAQNRPYSATDVLMNLHKEIGKTQVIKSLESLFSSGHLTEKAYGKQKIYFLNQAKLPAPADGEIKELEQTIKNMNKELDELRGAGKTEESKLSSLSTSLTTDEAKTRLDEVTSKLEKAKVKLASLQTTCESITPADQESVKKEHAKYTKEWKKRKRMCMDIVNAITESDGCVKSRKEMMEEMGIDTDEDMNVKIPEL